LKYRATAVPWFSTFFENASRKSLREQLQEIMPDYLRKFGVDAVAVPTRNSVLVGTIAVAADDE
jgi:hypothetical protein